MRRETDKNVHFLDETFKKARHEQLENAFDGGDGGGYDQTMEKRVEKLEEFVDEARSELRGIDVRLTKIEASVAQAATKSDLADAMNAQIKWVVGTGAVVGALALTIMTFTLNNAVPKSPTPPAAQPTPIVIYAQQPAPQGAPASNTQATPK